MLRRCVFLGWIVVVLTCVALPAEDKKPPAATGSSLLRDPREQSLTTRKVESDYAAREQLLKGSGAGGLGGAEGQPTDEELRRIQQIIDSQRGSDNPVQAVDVIRPEGRYGVSVSPVAFSESYDEGGILVLVVLGAVLAVVGGWWGLGRLLTSRRNRPAWIRDQTATANVENVVGGTRRDTKEVPLTGLARFRVVAGAVLGIGLFYILASLLVVVLSIVLVFGLAVGIGLARFGLWRLATPLVEPQVRLLVLLAKSAWTRNRPELFIALEPNDAPQLTAMVARLASAFAVPVPKRIVVEMTGGAWIELGGWRARSRSTKLGLGYDLIVGLSESELEAVIAHEMAHAKHVQRGLKRALNKGVARAARATNSVAQLVYAHRAAGVNFESGETVLTLLRSCTRFSAKRVAAYSRQDEFEADLGAARVCGGAPLRAALRRTQRIHEATARIGWTERLARMQTAGGLARWLAETLQGTAASMPAIAHDFDEYATHPSDEDRLRALPDTPAANPRDGSAICLFEDAGAIARRLIYDIQAKVLQEERRDTKTRARWLRRVRRGAKVRPRQWLPMFCAAIGGFMGLLTFETHSPWTAAAALAIIGAAGYWYRRERFRDHTPLPVPTLEQIKLGAEGVDDPATREARRKELDDAAEQQCAGLTQVEALERLRDEGYAALSRAEPLRAFVCFRRIERLRQGQPETDMLGAVTLAMLGADASPWVNAVAKNTGLHSTGSLWAAAWALQLMRKFENAEPMLAELRRRVPGEITFVGLLAVCQARRGKLQSALEHASAAFHALPTSTWRRELLVDLLVSTGRLDEAEKRLGEVSVADDPGLVLSALRLKLMKGEMAEADRWLAHVRALPEPGLYLLSAAGSYEQARCDEQARACYEAALGTGFYPAAELGLARLALHARDHAAVEQHAFATINGSRPLGPKAIGPLPLFLPAIGLLNATQPRSRNLTAWLVTAPTEPTLGAFQRHTFLVYSAGKDTALETVVRVMKAAFPDQAAVAPDRFSVAIATDDRQPLGAVHPGIQAVWV